MQLFFSDIFDVGIICAISIFFLNIIVSGFKKKREGGPSSLSKRLLAFAASVASARHGRLIQGHRLRTGLPVVTETVAVEKCVEGEGFCTC